MGPRENNNNEDISQAAVDGWAEQVKESFDNRQWGMYHALEARGFKPFYDRPGSTAEADAIAFMSDYLASVEGTFLMLINNTVWRDARDQLHEVVQSAVEGFQATEHNQSDASGDDAIEESPVYAGSIADVDFEARAWKASVASIDYLNRFCDEFGLAPYMDVDVLDDEALRRLGLQKHRELMRKRLNGSGGGDE